jgi:hypothetical protein
MGANNPTEELLRMKFSVKKTSSQKRKKSVMKECDEREVRGRKRGERREWGVKQERNTEKRERRIIYM